MWECNDRAAEPPRFRPAPPVPRLPGLGAARMRGRAPRPDGPCTEIRPKWTKMPAFSVFPGSVGAVSAGAGMKPLFRGPRRNRASESRRRKTEKGGIFVHFGRISVQDRGIRAEPPGGSRGFTGEGRPDTAPDEKAPKPSRYSV